LRVSYAVRTSGKRSREQMTTGCGAYFPVANDVILLSTKGRGSCGWRRSREKPLAPSHPKVCESMILGAPSVEPFYFTPFGSCKRLLKPLEKPYQTGP
jgi:hypothetical protein